MTVNSKLQFYSAGLGKRGPCCRVVIAFLLRVTTADRVAKINALIRNPNLKVDCINMCIHRTERVGVRDSIPPRPNIRCFHRHVR